MKKLYYYLLTITVLWFVFDRIGGAAMWWLNQHSQDNTSPKIKQIVEGVEADVIMMGTSRCNGHYVSSILQDSLGKTVYNAGVDGSDNIYAQYMVLCYLLQHHTPQLICLEVQNSYLEEEESAYRTMGYFAPYFGLNDKVDDVYHLSGDYWLYELSHLYRYNTKVLANLTGQVKHIWDQAELGYNPNPEPSVAPEIGHWPEEEVVVNETKRQYFQLFVDECRSRGINLCFVISPANGITEPNYFYRVRELAEANQVPLFDYRTPGLFLDHPEYFKDQVHLWDKGARLYTSIFASDLKRHLEQLQEATPN